MIKIYLTAACRFIFDFIIGGFRGLSTSTYSTDSFNFFEVLSMVTSWRTKGLAGNIALCMKTMNDWWEKRRESAFIYTSCQKKKKNSASIRHKSDQSLHYKWKVSSCWRRRRGISYFFGHPNKLYTMKTTVAVSLLYLLFVKA